MRVTQRNLQAQPKMLKKNSEHQINQSEQKFTLKIRAKNSYGDYPTEFAGSTHFCHNTSQ
jgi:hypothetical protein